MRPPRVALVALILVPALLAGCTDPAHEPERLRDAVTVGRPIYSWAVPEFHNELTAGSSSRINAEADVPTGTAAVGVLFTGRFRWSNSSAVFEVRDAQDVLVHLNASEGRTDDLGEIRGAWRFHRTYPLAPGPYALTLTGTGSIETAAFRLHGIDAGENAIDRTFTISDAGRRVDVRLIADGWGRAPAVTLHGPDGASTEHRFDRPDTDLAWSFTPDRGTYRFVVDTTGFGGRLVFDVQQP